ncbi:exonuclease SbcCD subunit D [Brachybacterium sp. EF45031]|uniref:exonuclease SbcCD subunit D n=1 Tax=Brachybacterium sillae TaxID=2810536 RepID=UPI00217D5354|nr:exonuclease SbcCD subunit D [Brachybacterium sillae]MCS6711478.1 exonuclease SbcCD subunit D [Brachybacterium sillae]
MRILHTSDWHLGRTLHGHELHEHHEAFHRELVATVRERQVDVVVIPGDVYDRAIPPVQSVTLLSRTLAQLAEITTVVLTPGNHDSAARLGFGREIMRDGIHLLTDTPGIDHPVTVEDEHGQVLFFGLPFLEPDITRHSLVAEGEDPLGRSHEAVTRAAMARVRARLEERTAALAGEGRPRPRSVVLAHTFVAGGVESESERDLTVGGVDTVPASVFTGIDYVALGHLHGCQDLSGLLRDAGGAMWYSGSPLPYSLSERNQRKAMLLVEMGADGVESVQRLPITQPRRIVELTGTLDEILAQGEVHGDDWAALTVTDRERPAHLQERLRAVFPHLLLVHHRPEGRELAARVREVRGEQDPMEVMGDFLAHATGGPADAQDLEILEGAWGAVRRRQQEAS